LNAIFGPGMDLVLSAQLGDALQAMHVLHRFDPRLTGSLAAGIADRQQAIVLHVRAEHADDVRMALDEHAIPVRMLQTKLHFPRAATQALPGLSFIAGQQEFVIWVFSEAQFRQRLRVGTDPEPAYRLSYAAVQRLRDALAAADTHGNRHSSGDRREESVDLLKRAR